MGRTERSSQTPVLEHADDVDDAEPRQVGPTSEAEDDVTEALIALLAPSTDADAPAGLPARITGIVVGTLVELGDRPLVTWPGRAGAVPARAAAALEPSHLGGEVALMFELGDPERPLVMGPVQTFAPAQPVAREEGVEIEAVADGERVVLSAERELVLRCGKASITLTRAGKILIRGAYVSSHADGTQRIRGGTVEIN